MIVLLPLFLLSCGPERLVMDLEIRARDDTHRLELIAAAKRVIEGRLSAIGETAEMIDIENRGGTIRMTVETNSETVTDVLHDQLTEPFSFRIMTEAADGKGDATIEGHGSFKQTGITEKHLLGVQAGPDDSPGKGRIHLNFSDEGRVLMGKIFRENKGKYIGLFVRNRLISKLQVDADEVRDQIIITDIPSLPMAQIFADDVNVGLFVTFTPTRG